MPLLITSHGLAQSICTWSTWTLSSEMPSFSPPPNTPCNSPLVSSSSSPDRWTMSTTALLSLILSVPAMRVAAGTVSPLAAAAAASRRFGLCWIHFLSPPPASWVHCSRIVCAARTCGTQYRGCCTVQLLFVWHRFGARSGTGSRSRFYYCTRHLFRRCYGNTQSLYHRSRTGTLSHSDHRSRSRTGTFGRRPPWEREGKRWRGERERGRERKRERGVIWVLLILGEDERRGVERKCWQWENWMVEREKWRLIWL